MKPTRRDFAKLCAGFAAVPGLRFPTAPRERIAVASYPFREFIGAKIALKDFAAMVADEFGIHAIEPLGSHFPSLEPAYLDGFRTAVEKARSRVVNIPADVDASVYDADAAACAKAVANGKKWIDAAAALGSPGVRIHVQGAKGVKPDVERAAGTLKAMADYGSAKGVIVSLENDDLVTEDAFFLVKVIERVNSPYLRALPDFGNSMLGGNEKFNYDAVAAMFRHATNIAHVKDSEVADGGRVFRVDMAKTFAIAKASGYRGYYSMEWEGQGGPYEGTRLLIAQSLKLM
ncbi:MAG: sugar phosphate isomerase/epimerase family protein [Acidobacteriota bacterium]